MSTYAHRQHTQADQHGNRDEYGVHPEERGRIAVPMAARPGAIVVNDGLGEARPDHHIENSRSNQEPTRFSRNHATISSHIFAPNSQE